MSEQWTICTQPAEYIEAVRAEYMKHTSDIPLQVLRKLVDQEALGMDTGEPALLKVIFTENSTVHIPRARIKKSIPVPVEVLARDETGLTEADLYQRWGNRLPDLRSIIAFGGGWFLGDSRYFTRHHIEPSELSPKDYQKWLKADPVQLNLTGLRFVPSGIGFSLTWGHRYEPFCQRQINTSYLDKGLITRQEWETVIQDRYHIIQSD